MGSSPPQTNWEIGESLQLVMCLWTFSVLKSCSWPAYFLKCAFSFLEGRAARPGRSCSNVVEPQSRSSSAVVTLSIQLSRRRWQWRRRSPKKYDSIVTLGCYSAFIFPTLLLLLLLPSTGVLHNWQAGRNGEWGVQGEVDRRPFIVWGEPNKSAVKQQQQPWGSERVAGGRDGWKEIRVVFRRAIGLPGRHRVPQSIVLLTKWSLHLPTPTVMMPRPSPTDYSQWEGPQYRRGWGGGGVEGTGVDTHRPITATWLWQSAPPFFHHPNQATGLFFFPFCGAQRRRQDESIRDKKARSFNHPAVRLIKMEKSENLEKSNQRQNVRELTFCN